MKSSFQKTICVVLILSFLLQSIPQTAQAGLIDSLLNAFSKLASGIAPTEIKWEENHLKLKTSDGDDRLSIKIHNPLYSWTIGNDQTKLTDDEGRPKIPAPNIPSICELRILPPPDEQDPDKFLTPEERKTLNDACYDLLRLKRAAANQVYFAKQIFNKTDPLSDCFMFKNCKTSCSLRLGKIAYVIHWLDIAEMFLPTGWIKTIYKIGQIISTIKGVYDKIKTFVELLTTTADQIVTTIKAGKAFIKSFKNILRVSDDKGIENLLRNFADNLYKFIQAKGELSLMITNAQKDANTLIKGLQNEPGIAFLFQEGSEHKEKRRELQKIIDDYILAGFETPQAILQKFEDNAKFLAPEHNYLDSNGNPIPGPPVATTTKEECLKQGECKGVCYSPYNNWFTNFKDFYLDIKKINSYSKASSENFAKCEGCKNLPWPLNEKCEKDYCPAQILSSLLNFDFTKTTGYKETLLEQTKKLPSDHIWTDPDPNPPDLSVTSTQYWSSTTIDVSCPQGAELQLDPDTRHYFCKFKLSSCANVPNQYGKWKQYRNWSTTQGRGTSTDYPSKKGCKKTDEGNCGADNRAHGCYSSNNNSDGTYFNCYDYNIGDYCRAACSIIGHSWQNKPQEWCQLTCGTKSGWQTHTGYSLITEIGCVPEQKTEDWKWMCDYNNNLITLDWDNIIQNIRDQNNNRNLKTVLNSIKQDFSSDQAAKFNEFLINPLIHYLLSKKNQEIDQIKKQIQGAIDKVKNESIEQEIKNAIISVLDGLIKNADDLKIKFETIKATSININNIWTKPRGNEKIDILTYKESYTQDILETIRLSQDIVSTLVEAQEIFNELKNTGECLLKDNIKDCLKDYIPSDGEPMDADGNPTSQENVVFYKFPRSSCPPGWKPYPSGTQYWSRTRNTSGEGNWDKPCNELERCNKHVSGSCSSSGCEEDWHGGDEGCKPKGTTMSHEWNNQPPEVCTVRCGIKCDTGTEKTGPTVNITAEITEIGCVLSDITLPASVKQELEKVFGSNGSLNSIEKFLISDAQSLKNIIGKYECDLTQKGFLNRINCFEQKNGVPPLTKGRSFYEILVFIKAMLRLNEAIRALEDLRTMIIELNPDKGLEIRTSSPCQNFACLKEKVKTDPLINFQDIFNNIKIAINTVKCKIQDVYYMNKGGIPMDAQGATTTSDKAVFYKFSENSCYGGAQCPDGWTQYLTNGKPWTTTCNRQCWALQNIVDECNVYDYYNSKNCGGSSGYNRCKRDDPRPMKCEGSGYCSAWALGNDNCAENTIYIDDGRPETGEHSWANKPRETSAVSCAYDTDFWDTDTLYANCPAKVIEIGCVPEQEIEDQIFKDQDILDTGKLELGTSTLAISKQAGEIEVKIFGDDKVKKGCQSIDMLLKSDPQELKDTCENIELELKYGISTSTEKNIEDLCEAEILNKIDLECKNPPKECNPPIGEEIKEENKKFCEENKKFCESASTTPATTPVQDLNQYRVCQVKAIISHKMEIEQIKPDCDNYYLLQKALQNNCGASADPNKCNEIRVAIGGQSGINNLVGLCSDATEGSWNGQIPDLTNATSIAQLKKARIICDRKRNDLITPLTEIMDVFWILLAVKSATAFFKGLSSLDILKADLNMKLERNLIDLNWDKCKKFDMGGCVDFPLDVGLDFDFDFKLDPLAPFKKIWEEAKELAKEIKGLPKKIKDMAKGDVELKEDPGKKGLVIQEYVRCIANPAEGYKNKTGPEGGPVCPETDYLFSIIEANFTIIRQSLLNIDLKRRDIKSMKDLFRITLGKIIPNLGEWCDENNCGYKEGPLYDRLKELYDQGEDIKKKSMNIWALGTAMNFASARCVCGQSFCKFPVCISGLPLTPDVIGNPYCYLIYILRHPLLNATKKLEGKL